VLVCSSTFITSCSVLIDLKSVSLLITLACCRPDMCATKFLGRLGCAGNGRRGTCTD
jgi:hypothetical protein